MRVLSLLLFLLSLETLSQQSSEWLEKLESPKYFTQELKPENLLKQHLEYDYSSLLSPRSDFLGYIGKDYRRVKVYFHSIEKSDSAPNVYLISGETTVFSNTCDFEGSIIIEQVREYKDMHFGVDEMYKDAGFRAQGLAIGRYRFSENPKQSQVGVFDGVMTVWWYVDKNGKIHYDNLESHSDSFKNNQFVGVWREYGKSDAKSCNWGEQRIPFSGDLDIGAGQFSVNRKYLDKGWEEFKMN